MAGNTILKLNKLTRTEEFLAFSGNVIDEKGGCIGHLRGDFDSKGFGFFTSWWPHADLAERQEEFSVVLTKVMEGFKEMLRGNSKNPVNWRRKCSAFCAEFLDRNFGDRGYGARADLDGFTFIFRLSPRPGDYDLYLYCYKSDSLDTTT